MKYPRTYHLPESQGRSNDDKILKDYTNFIGKEVSITMKMDGENSTLTKDKCYARSPDSKYHESRTYLNAFHGSIKHEIPEKYRIVVENLYAKHSIKYENLKSYFYGINVWDDDLCLSWNECLDWFEIFGIYPVEEIYRGMFDLDLVISLIKNWNNENEGFVIRNVNEFKYKDFSKNVGKFVRKGHVQNNKHWMFSKIERNELNNNE